MTVQVRHVQAGDVRTLVRETGDGEDVLALLHGAEADSSMWDPYIEGLAKGRRVLAVDLPGHGGTDAPADLDASVEGIVRWFSDYLAAEGLDSVDLLAHSMGGLVALHLSLEVPHLLKRLVLVDTGGLCWPASPIGEGVDEFLRILVEGEMDEDRARVMAAEIYGWDPEGDAARESGRFWSRPGVRTFFSNGGLVFTRPIPVWRLREMATETMLIWGERDRWFPLATAKEAMMYIPGYRLVVIEGGSHSPFVDAPGLFHLTVDMFLSDEG
ncbi:MAG: alpha/beta hydrolase [Thermoplasmata archaeon]|nr:MAG: alpha/beta hydrolase [Thermoplasmata archaeon]